MTAPAAPTEDPEPRGTAPRRSVAPDPLITAHDVKRELYRLFGTGEGELVVSIYGGDDDAGAVATFDELMGSLAMHANGFPEGGLPDVEVAAPDAEMIERALLVLSQPDLQRILLDDILTTFGRRLIDPLTELLDAGPDGAIMAKLVLMRQQMLRDVSLLAVTHETRQVLEADMRQLLTDDYLDRLAQHEEQTQQPRVRRLAQEILRMIGDTFHAALARWPGHARAIARGTHHRVTERVTLRELPGLIRAQVIDGIEEFLWVETSNDIRGALSSMLVAQRGILEAPPELERAAYREFAECCWRLVTRVS